jgi:hypothetical protein
MGLLDDAIRDHLELKRRSGADPGAIAQAEHEALDPIFPEEPAPHAGDDAAHDAGAVAVEEPQPSTAAEDDFSNVGQETAELDMQAVLDEQPPTPPAGMQPVRAVSPSSAEPEEIDWHDDGRAGQQPLPEEIPGQERLTFD